MKRKYFLVTELFVFSVAAIIIITSEVNLPASKHTTLLFPPQDIRYFSLGYQESLADLFWIRALQDIDLCGQTKEIKLNPLPGMKMADELEQSDDQKVMPDINSLAKCENGWSAKMLDTITELAPRFKIPYIAGGTILSIVVRDNVGAGKIFKKGVDRFPTDWTMAYRAAYHSMAALADYPQAASYLVQAGKNGAPGWVFALASKLQSRVGQAILSKPILQEAIDADPESRWAPDLRKRLDEVNKIIEKGE